MKTYRKIIFLLILTAVAGCSATPVYVTPLDTLKTYTKAIKNNDTATMKKLLSTKSLKNHEQEAQAQGVSIDEIIKRETLFNQNQTSLKFRNEKIENEKATIEVENSFGAWDVVPFVKEDGIWKIDKKGLADQMQQQIEQENNQGLDNIMNQGRIP